LISFSSVAVAAALEMVGLAEMAVLVHREQQYQLIRIPR
jgi:hypothetical protein